MKTMYITLLIAIITGTATAQQGESAIPIKDTVYTFCDTMPKYPGGVDEMRKFISKNLTWPDDGRCCEMACSSWKIYVRFVVSETGKIRDPKIVRGKEPALCRESLRIIRLLPDFKPGIKNGKPVSVYYIVPISFKVE